MRDSCPMRACMRAYMRAARAHTWAHAARLRVAPAACKRPNHDDPAPCHARRLASVPPGAFGLLGHYRELADVLAAKGYNSVIFDWRWARLPAGTAAACDRLESHAAACKRAPPQHAHAMRKQ